MDIVQYMWQTGDIPQDLGLTVLVLIPKVTTDTKGIGLLETLWKVVEVPIDTCIRASLQYHDALHGLRSGRGTGKATMELKLSQELSSIDHDPLFLVFLDLQKEYSTMDRENLIHTLEEYSAGTRMCRLLETLWSHQKLLPRHNGYHKLALPTTQRMTQIGLISPTLFNVVVDNVIRTWLSMTVEDQRVSHD